MKQLKEITMNKLIKNNLNNTSIIESKDSISFYRQLAIQHAHTAHRLVQQRYVNDAKAIFVDKGR